MNKDTNKSNVSRLVSSLLFSSIWLTPPLLAEIPPSEPELPPQEPELIRENIYEKAQRELPEDWYAIYRIVDRMARANQLNLTPWRVAVVTEYEIDTFATESDLIALDRDILVPLAGDASALACAIGREMAHHAKGHTVMGEAEKAAAIEQYEREARAEAMAEAEESQKQGSGSGVGGSILRTIGGLFGGIGSQVGSIGGAVLDSATRPQQSTSPDMEERIEEIVALKEAQLEARLLQESRDREFEADEVAYQYIVRAGFEPQGCLRLMEALARTSDAESDGSSPSVAERIERLNGLATRYPPTMLGLEGKDAIFASQPLTYALSEDGTSLRVNSQREGSTAEDIDRLFGK